MVSSRSISHTCLYASQILLKTLNSSLTPCMQLESIEYILLTSLLSVTILKKLEGFSVMTGFSSFFAL